MIIVLAFIGITFLQQVSLTLILVWFEKNINKIFNLISQLFYLVLNS